MKLQLATSLVIAVFLGEMNLSSAIQLQQQNMVDADLYLDVEGDAFDAQEITQNEEEEPASMDEMVSTNVDE